MSSILSVTNRTLLIRGTLVSTFAGLVLQPVQENGSRKAAGGELEPEANLQGRCCPKLGSKNLQLLITVSNKDRWLVFWGQRSIL